MSRKEKAVAILQAVAAIIGALIKLLSSAALGFVVALLLT